MRKLIFLFILLLSSCTFNQGLPAGHEDYCAENPDTFICVITDTKAEGGQNG